MRIDITSTQKDGKLIKGILNKLGKEGWEIINVIRDEFKCDTYFLKRKK